MTNAQQMLNLYEEGIFAGILEVVQYLYPEDKWKEEYIKLLQDLDKDPDVINYWVNDRFFKGK